MAIHQFCAPRLHPELRPSQGHLDRSGAHTTLNSNEFEVGSLAPCVRSLHMRNTVWLPLFVLVNLLRGSPDLGNASPAFLAPRGSDVCLCETRVVRC